MKQREDCSICNATGLCDELGGEESACMICNGKGYIEWDYDPSPYCSCCGAMKKANCHCGPIPDND